VAGLRPPAVQLSRRAGDPYAHQVTTDGSLLSPADVRELATRLRVRPTKRLGQNFVIDQNTVRRIARSAGVRDDDVVLEVGPGLGSLTLALLPLAARVYAVEIDGVLAQALPGTVERHAPALAERLSVLHADALTLDSLPVEPSLFVANLPYNVAVPVLLHLLAMFPSLRSGLVMVQAEVADRLAAAPGTKVYGIPSVKAQWYADVRRAGTVGRSVFWPTPNVDSGLVSFTSHPPPTTRVPRHEVFAVVDAAFAQRRKTLRAALTRWAGSPADAEATLRAAGIDPGQRGERLRLADFVAIAEQRPSP